MSSNIICKEEHENHIFSNNTIIQSNQTMTQFIKEVHRHRNLNFDRDDKLKIQGKS